MSGDLRSAESAVPGGRLTDPAWLVNADPEHVLAALDGASGPQESAAAAVYRVSGHAHRDADAGTRRQILALDAVRYGHRELARALARQGVDWGVEWATGTGVDSRLRFSLPAPAEVDAVSVLVVEGSGLAVAGCKDGTLHWWDTDTGGKLGEIATGHEGKVRGAVTAAVLDGRPVAVTSGVEGTVRTWDLTAGEPLGVFRCGDDSWVKSLTTGLVEGRPVVVGACVDGVLLVWDLAALTGHGEPLAVRTGFVSALATTVLDGRALAVTSHSAELGALDPVTGYETLRMWDLVTGREVGPGRDLPEPPTATGGEGRRCASLDINAQASFLATDPTSDCTLAVSANAYEAHVWNLATGEQAGEPVPGFVETAAVRSLHGRPVAVVGGHGPVEVWDLAARTHLHPPLTGHVNTVRGAATAVVRARHLAVTGGDDRSVRVWDLDRERRTDSGPADRTGSVREFTTAVVDGRPVLVTGDSDGRVRIRDLDDGRPLGEPLAAFTDAVSLLTVGTVEGRPTLLTRDARKSVRIWDLAGREELHGRSTREYTLDTIHFFAVVDGRFAGVTWEGRVWDLAGSRWLGVQPKQSRARALALETPAGRPLVLTGSATDPVHLWDLTTGDPVGPPLTGHTGEVRAGAVGMLDGRLVVAAGGRDRAVRVWDATTGRQLGRYAFPAGIRRLAMASDGRLVVGFGSDVAVLSQR